MSRSRHRWAHRTVLAVAVAGCLCALAACGPTQSAGSTSTPSPTSAHPTASLPSDTITADYLPGLPAELRFPAQAGPAPLIVMVPGGGWSSADPTGLVPLAKTLTDQGASTALITYATTSTGSTFPEAVDDVACAVRWSAQQATTEGHPPTHVIVLGHSAGGHLASLVTFSGEEFGGTCPYPPVAIDGLIGMAGVYDTDAFRPVLADWMGVSPNDAADTWRRANPLAWLREGTGVPKDLRVLLIHGDADTSVPMTQTTQLAQDLGSAGIDVETAVLPGLDHLQVFEAPHAAPPISTWMKEWPAVTTQATP